MKLGIMQPYFLPYIGYFQLIAAVDLFVVHDQVKYTKSGWINRNRMLRGGEDAVFTLPLAKGSDSLDIRDRRIAADFAPDKLLAKLSGAYAKAPHFDATMAILEPVVRFEDRNLFRFIHHSIARVCAHLGIATTIEVASNILVDDDLAGEDRVLALCAAAGATTYINPIGGLDLYSRDRFASRGVELKFLRSTAAPYAQFGRPFVPWLSIVDVLMFNDLAAIEAALSSGYELVEPRP
jgi:hypothetical protein